MARTDKRITWKTLFVFWVKVVVLCSALGAGSFYLGRNYLGDMISETDIREGAPRLSAQALDGSGEARVAEGAGPAKPEIRIEERQPSELEAKRAVEEAGGRGDADSGTSLRGDGSAAGTTDDAGQTTPATDGAAATTATSGDAPAGQTSEASDDGQFIVTAGSFVSAENSQQLLRELEAKGYQPYISTATVGDKTYRRVNIGAFSNRRDASKLAEELRNSGYEASVRAR